MRKDEQRIKLILKRIISFVLIIGISTYVLNILVHHVYYVEDEEKVIRILQIVNFLFWLLVLTYKDEDEFGKLFGVIAIIFPFYAAFVVSVFEQKIDPKIYIYGNSFMLLIVFITRLSYNFALKIVGFTIVGLTLGIFLCFGVAIAIMSIMDIGRGGSTSPSQQIQEDSDPATHRVNGYYRKDGTHVDSYIRSNPDGNADNNLKK
ncbi:hypothetical protein CN268_20160 [Bacillus anthracis]|nr:hypothetical protein CN268_20160 [Bacillus anthracis]